MGSNISIAVIGAGAIGGITAACIAKAGYNVQLVCKHADKAAQIAQEGIHITGVRGEQRIKLRAVAEIEQLSGTIDILMIATKAYDMPDAARRARPHLKRTPLWFPCKTEYASRRWLMLWAGSGRSDAWWAGVPRCWTTAR